MAYSNSTYDRGPPEPVGVYLCEIFSKTRRVSSSTDPACIAKPFGDKARRSHERRISRVAQTVRGITQTRVVTSAAGFQLRRAYSSGSTAAATVVVVRQLPDRVRARFSGDKGNARLGGSRGNASGCARPADNFRRWRWPK